MIPTDHLISFCSNGQKPATLTVGSACYSKASSKFLPRCLAPTGTSLNVQENLLTPYHRVDVILSQERWSVKTVLDFHGLYALFIFRLDLDKYSGYAKMRHVNGKETLRRRGKVSKARCQRAAGRCEAVPHITETGLGAPGWRKSKHGRDFPLQKTISACENMESHQKRVFGSMDSTHEIEWYRGFSPFRLYGSERRRGIFRFLEICWYMKGIDAKD